MKPRGLTPSAMVIALALQTASAQTQTPRAPTFGSGAELVLVDVVAVDKKGEPVLDLTQSDFRVFEDGKERDIASFAAFGTAAAKALAKAASIAQDGFSAPPPVPFVPASTVILIDEGHLSPMETAHLGPTLERIMSDLVERRGWLLVLAPASKVAYAAHLPEDRSILTEALNRHSARRFPEMSNLPMTDTEAIEIEHGNTNTLKVLTARFNLLVPGLGSQAESMVRMRATELFVAAKARRHDTFDSMQQGFAWLSKQPGRHTFLLVTAGFTNDATDPGFDDVINASLRVNAPIHFLDVAALQTTAQFEGIEYKYALPQDARVSPFDSTDAAEGSNQLAINTGGLRVPDSDLERGFKSIMDATRLYYILGYEPVMRGKRGFHKIRVEVKRKDVRLRSRRGYFEEDPSKSAAAQPSGS